jgi:OFA family oxalate/formate antiporter-like MFS transporter
MIDGANPPAAASALGSRWIYVAVGAALMLILGLIFAWSVFVLPLENEFGWSREQTSLTFAITMAFFAAGIILGGALADRKGPRLVCLVAGALTGGGLFSASFTASPAHLYLSYGLVCGLSIGIADSCTVSTVVRWFPDHRGAVAGVLMMGFGFGGLFLGLGAGRLIEAFGWRAAFRILGAVTFVAIAALGGFLRPCTAVSGDQALPNAEETGAAGPRDYDWREVLREPPFWWLWFWQVSIFAGGLTVVGHVVPLAVEKGFHGDQAAYALGVFSVLNGIGRVVFGVLSDKFGKRVMLADSALMVAAMLLIAGGFSSQGFHGFLFSVTLAGLAFSGAMPQASSAVAALFGSRHYGANFGLIHSGLVVASLLGPYLSGLLRVTAGGYGSGFLFLAGVAGLGLIAGTRIGAPKGQTSYRYG